MRTLERGRIDAIARELGPGAQRLALSLGFDMASAERVLLEAFASLAPSLARVKNTIELQEKLYARIRQRVAKQSLQDGARHPEGEPDQRAREDTGEANLLDDTLIGFGEGRGRQTKPAEHHPRGTGERDRRRALRS